MTTNSPGGHLSELEACRYRFGPGSGARVVKLLRKLDATRLSDPRVLIRFHETLLFLRAFPYDPGVLQETEHVLNHFDTKVEALRKTGSDMDAFDPLEVAGIAGTRMEDTLSFDLAHWLVRRMCSTKVRPGGAKRTIRRFSKLTEERLNEIHGYVENAPRLI